MKLSKEQREQVRMMFGGKCAYCGVLLDGKWHADHVEAVKRDGNWVSGKWKLNGALLKPENDRADNLFPSCVKCNILKSSASVDEFRKALAYFARSIPTIRTYSHVHHLMRFGRLHIDTAPVVFWFERFRQEEDAV